MGGRRGGLLNSIGNATGLNSVASGSARYLLNPLGIGAIGGAAQVAYENTIQPMNEAKQEAKREVARQQGIQRENERMASEQQQTQETARGFREQRRRQRMLAASRQGRASTILTSPLGATASAPEAGGKKLLGE